MTVVGEGAGERSLDPNKSTLSKQFTKGKESGDLSVVGICTPGFKFPTDEFYTTTTFGRGGTVRWDGTTSAGYCIQAFFKRIAVQLSTHASDTILETQAA